MRAPTMTSCTSRLSVVFLCGKLLLLLLVASPVSSIPHALITTGKAYCRSATLAQDTYIKILFEAPDVLEVEDPNKNAASNYLTVVEKPAPSALQFLRDEEGKTTHYTQQQQQQQQDRRKPKPASFEIKQKEGTFVYHVQQDSTVNICIRASAASKRKPMRFGFLLEEIGDRELAESKIPQLETVDTHLSFMEKEFVRIESQMHAMIKEANFARERDSIYHSKTDAMHKATMFWPIVHVGILLITGFTQANHIVQFFKKRRII